MSDYFESCKSIRFSQGLDTNGILATVANRYLSSNPARPFVFRLSSARGFPRNGAYRYVFDFRKIYPEAENEQSVFAWAKIWSEDDGSRPFLAVPYSPMRVFVNEEPAYHSDYYEEKNGTARGPFQAKLHKGWNSIVLCFVKTPLGFGGEFGSSFFKYTPVHFLAPTAERDGREGFLYTLPFSGDGQSDFPTLGMSEAESSVPWFPDVSWSEEKMRLGQLERIFGRHPGCYAYGWAKIFLSGKNSVYELSGRCAGRLSLFVNGEKVFESQMDGAFRRAFQTPGRGLCDIVAESECGTDSWGFQLAVDCGDRKAGFFSPCNVKGTKDPWIYAGTFSERQNPESVATMSRLFRTDDGDDYWHADLPDRYVRPFLESDNFGQWSYPVGVTLYGLMQAGEMLKRRDILDYVKQHVRLCTEFYEYALWDRKKFGAAGVDAQIASIESLDDCGSFASTMLELASRERLPEARKIADTVADFISNRQTRLPDGTLYRLRSSLAEMKNTVWLDDLYMSVPFLARYYRLTGDPKYLDDAARQFFLYREKMLIPRLGVMSHVYYTERKLASGIPWGRGNGWVLFSLSELLLAMPKDYPCREDLLSMFRAFCDGCIALQSEDGMWHQVLNDSDSYEESSCSSMLVSAIARGVRCGWLPDEGGKYIDAVIKGWTGLTENAVDCDGNIYGICKGSGHSFTPRYYKYELNWILNDCHGIGILLLAGVETQKMMDSFCQEA
ncbi:MAG: glycoside hydrolase family 88 protein [Oscillospiraceae bacterium]|nr:glycoside hydrolase family 88 protein [Oscillospiraceae bacterium]MCI1991267.1 glycoside hydrolase family 88 protein [Oscillospiraceae bacterium]MCI2035733.1 glycoside hydrolase family 88 protein [Oscillospiraceae bacterium]